MELDVHCDKTDDPMLQWYLLEEGKVTANVGRAVAARADAAIYGIRRKEGKVTYPERKKGSVQMAMR
jgi:hypothetical protein